MNIKDIGDSELVKNALGGKMPDVAVTVETQSIINMAVSVVIVGTVLILVWKIVKNI
jgi:hypothetical protein